MDARWGIIAFRHNAGRVSYIWTHATVHVLKELTEKPCVLGKVLGL